MVSYKKAISPVVATALLLVVAVVAVVGFQSWFTTYQSGINVKVEQESDAGSSVTIERLEWVSATAAKIYVKNTANAAVNISANVPSKCTTPVEVEVPKKEIGEIDVTTCTSFEKGVAYDVVATSTSGVFSATLISR